MASNRCFDSYNAKLSASERSVKKRTVAIYNEILKNVEQYDTANPVKQNGYTYNRNSIVNQTCDISSGYVDVAVNYAIRADIKQGASTVYPVQVSTPKYESWCGNLYSVDYVKHGVGHAVLSISDVSGYIHTIDPSNVLFYSECDLMYENINRPEQWTTVVDLSFQATYFAQSATGIQCKAPPPPPPLA